jgi:hypothetical protein
MFIVSLDCSRKKKIKEFGHVNNRQPRKRIRGNHVTG